MIVRLLPTFAMLMTFELTPGNAENLNRTVILLPASAINAERLAVAVAGVDVASHLRDAGPRRLTVVSAATDPAIVQNFVS